MNTIKRINLKVLAAAASVALLMAGTGASGIAFAQGTPPIASSAAAEDSATGPDTDLIQEQVGDQNAPDAAEAGSKDADSVQEQVGDQSTPDTAPEAPEAIAP